MDRAGFKRALLYGGIYGDVMPSMDGFPLAPTLGELQQRIADQHREAAYAAEQRLIDKAHERQRGKQ
jgi:hypothetical protein